MQINTPDAGNRNRSSLAVWHIAERVHMLSPMTLSLLIALSLTLSYPPFPFPLLQVPAFFGLMRLASRPISMRSFLGYSYLAFVLWNLGTTYWLMMAHVGAGVAAILANAAVMLLPMLVVRMFVQANRDEGLPVFWAAVGIASAWAGYEFLHHRWDLAWPWLSLGNAWSQWIPLVQYLSLTGIFGVAFWVVLSASLLFFTTKASFGEAGFGEVDCKGVGTRGTGPFDAGSQDAGSLGAGTLDAGSSPKNGPSSDMANPSTRNKKPTRPRQTIFVVAMVVLMLPPGLSAVYYSMAFEENFYTLAPQTEAELQAPLKAKLQAQANLQPSGSDRAQAVPSTLLEVVIVQPNSNSYEPLGGHESLTHLTDYLLALTNRARTDSTDLILWPENALDTSISLQNGVVRRISDSTRVWNSSLVTGAGYVKAYRTEDDAPLLNRKSEGGIAYNIYNAALFFRPDGDISTYLKGRLVPFVERFPFVDFLFRLDRFGWVPWERFYGYGLGTDAAPFTLPSGESFPALICYDSVFPEWVNGFEGGVPERDTGQGLGNDSHDSRQHTGQNAGRQHVGFLAIITNDGWWGNSAGHIQHFEYARLRAVEHRQWVVRSANNGISGAINPRGEVVHKTDYWTEDAFRQTISTNPYPTWYARHGDWVGGISLLFVFLGLMRLRFGRK